MRDTAGASATRDTRLLVMTLALSAGMLLILASFRFPQSTTTPAVPLTPAAPLERLAARATYAELARVLAGLDRQIAPRLVALRTPAAPDAGLAPALDVPAVRVGPDRAIALVGPDRRADGFAKSADVEGIIALDGPRGLALVKVVAGPDAPEISGGEVPAGPGYAAAVEAVAHGLGVRPFYYGRVDREPDARWEQPALRFSALQHTPPSGSAIFLLDGTFVGLGTADERGFVVVPAGVLRSAVTRLEASGSVPVVDIGAEVAPLTDDLQHALGVDFGIVVTHVLDGGPASGVLEPGDVLRRIDGREMRTMDDFRAAIARDGSGTIAVDFRRRAESIAATIDPSGSRDATEQGLRQLGLDMRAVRGAGSEVVRVAPRSAAARAGLVAGDVITLIDQVKAPSPDAIERAFRNRDGRERLVVGVQRGRRHLLLVLTVP